MRPEPVSTGRLVLIALVLAAVGPFPMALAAARTPQHEVEGRLMCYCGCSDLTVRVCTCGTAEGIRGEIADLLAQGRTPDQVVAVFVARHGEQIRSAPDKRGFELVAWITPFAVLFLAGSALVLVVRRWGAARPVTTTSGSTQPSEARASSTPAERQALERVRREMKEES